jgi:hypothetical protein
LVLKSDQARLNGDSDYQRLYVLQKKSGQLMLVSALKSESYIGEPFGDDTLFNYVFLRTVAVGVAPKKGANHPTSPPPPAPPASQSPQTP